ncbi:hypothetical protein HDU83_002857 [Entophlyctis luteolus]|nr:hypothetical protein HDU83_002857 [Entophlyctis luteolus]
MCISQGMKMLPVINSLLFGFLSRVLKHVETVDDFEPPLLRRRSKSEAPASSKPLRASGAENVATSPVWKWFRFPPTRKGKTALGNSRSNNINGVETQQSMQEISSSWQQQQQRGLKQTQEQNYAEQQKQQHDQLQTVQMRPTTIENRDTADTPRVWESLLFIASASDEQQQPQQQLQRLSSRRAASALPAFGITAADPGSSSPPTRRLSKKYIHSKSATNLRTLEEDLLADARRHGRSLQNITYPEIPKFKAAESTASAVDQRLEANSFLSSRTTKSQASTEGLQLNKSVPSISLSQETLGIQSSLEELQWKHQRQQQQQQQQQGLQYGGVKQLQEQFNPYYFSAQHSMLRAPPSPVCLVVLPEPTKCELKIEREPERKGTRRVAVRAKSARAKANMVGGLDLAVGEWHRVTASISADAQLLQASVTRLLATDTQTWSLRGARVETKGFNAGAGRHFLARVGLVSGTDVILSFGDSRTLQTWKDALHAATAVAGRGP